MGDSKQHAIHRTFLHEGHELFMDRVFGSVLRWSQIKSRGQELCTIIHFTSKQTSENNNVHKYHGCLLKCKTWNSFTMHASEKKKCFSFTKTTTTTTKCHASKKSAFIIRTTNGNLCLIGDALLTDLFPHPWPTLCLGAAPLNNFTFQLLAYFAHINLPKAYQLN